MKLPESPDDMPSAWHNDQRQIRNAIVSLDEYACVDIHWERDDRATDLTGETVGLWEIAIESGTRRVKSKHPQITNALWFATTMMDAQVQAACEARNAARQAALAKLSPEDRKILGLPQ
jgi:transcription initiation factor IIE alpha subunit